MLMRIVAFIVSTAGIVSYANSPNGKALLFSVSGDIYNYNFAGLLLTLFLCHR
ncbi:hypothetical protein GPUN_0399 [Glaciecola punicea ACAM 611]|jgi:hypothetical protein|uniref:Uncharacterized protein n=1 Tax=Glaciecola punicea ACAM 611 TaxID=1121923 RepID=H5T8A5_9ALTE|nr:hypothetical protein GPUN_0399 [Glaciecola punicea ACAM 611]